MRIGLDARWIFPEISGIGSYTRELLRQFARLDRENEYFLFFDNPDVMARMAAETGFGARPNFKACPLPYGLFAPRNQFDLPRQLRALRLDVFHSPNYMIPLAAFPRDRAGQVKCVVTIHDLIPLLFPEFAPRSRKRRLFFLYKWLMREVARRADVLITVSEASRRDIETSMLRQLPHPPAVAVTPEGVAPMFQPPLVRAPAADRRRRIFWVGRPDPYKNQAGLIRAFDILRRRLDCPLQLRLAGAPDPRYPEAPRLVAELGLTEMVEWLGYLTDARLLAEYQQADLFVLPSYYEGFGLPVLEAMACGAPVVCADCASLPEVAGDAALLAAPHDHAALADAMRRILADADLSRDLTARGLARAAQFDWETTARLTLDAYRRAEAGGRICD